MFPNSLLARRMQVEGWMNHKCIYHIRSCWGDLGTFSWKYSMLNATKMLFFVRNFEITEDCWFIGHNVLWCVLGCVLKMAAPITLKHHEIWKRSLCWELWSRLLFITINVNLTLMFGIRWLSWFLVLISNAFVSSPPPKTTSSPHVTYQILMDL